MSKRMLIDGAHPEETRVVVTSGNHLEEYDIETIFKKQEKGNIYLAKITRVEPSLQAAFVDFGGNRHGFLAFSEIHPDYFQIPIEDRQALIEEQEALEMKARAAQEHLDDIEGDHSETVDDDPETNGEADGLENNESEDIEVKASTAENKKTKISNKRKKSLTETDSNESGKGQNEQATIDDTSTEDLERLEPQKNVDNPLETAPDIDEGLDGQEATPSQQSRNVKKYKIQEVIKRRQILLVQVVKEERGNKGAALTTYISLAGRYCVLMPNSSRGGGISRKITGANERRKLRETLNSLDIPDGMGVIIRTAGLQRNKAEIKRDFEYLIRAWDEVRAKTLKSTAPEMVYEEGDIIKRAIRDLYSKDIDEIQIDGTKTYQNAKRFMRLMMPSHAKRVQQYRDEAIPLFQRFQIEQQLDGMNHAEVLLKSGGYIVISPTEALVAIDVNSGKSTRERNIEETALKTNMEAADEIARQLRLRDLSGLIVIDFIDMEDSRNVRKVERKLKDAMRVDRARLQIGRISVFGLLELSRQRLRPSLLETSSQVCPHCRGTGNVLATETMAMRTLRAIEEEGIRNRSSEVQVKVPHEVALYILNQKRSALVSLEKLYGFQVILEGDDTVVPPDIEIDVVKGQPAPSQTVATNIDPGKEESKKDANTDAKRPENDEPKPAENQTKRKRRRSRRRPPMAEQTTDINSSKSALNSDEKVAVGSIESANKSDEKAPEISRHRRGRRGGRRRPRKASENKSVSAGDNVKNKTEAADARRENAKKTAKSPKPSKDTPTSVSPSETDELSKTQFEDKTLVNTNVDDSTDKRPKRRGWWQKITE
ncbi:MAG: ribonuclease E/G [Pseudomonadota bacterium]|nr:ribonuclease E/G [Pseudomonadota bacterium]